MQDHDHVGIQSAIDLREARETQLLYRGDIKKDIPISTGTKFSEEEVYDPTSLLIIEDAPLRYDVDIVTKLIVYAGIGMVAAYIAPILFQFMSLSL